MTKTNANCPILIVDDDPQNLAALRHVLGSDYPLAFANNGHTALKAVRRLAPALILMDIQMPGMDGYQVCRELKSDPLSDHIPVIFVSSLSETGNEAEGFAAGAVDYITKPVSPPSFGPGSAPI
jgi:putative two-component system response regulator